MRNDRSRVNHTELLYIISLKRHFINQIFRGETPAFLPVHVWEEVAIFAGPPGGDLAHVPDATYKEVAHSLGIKMETVELK